MTPIQPELGWRSEEGQIRILGSCSKKAEASVLRQVVLSSLPISVCLAVLVVMCTEQNLSVKSIGMIGTL